MFLLLALKLDCYNVKRKIPGLLGIIFFSFPEIPTFPWWKTKLNTDYMQKNLVRATTYSRRFCNPALEHINQWPGLEWRSRNLSLASTLWHYISMACSATEPYKKTFVLLFIGIAGQLKAFVLAALKALVLRHLLGIIRQVLPMQRGSLSIFN